MYKSIYYDRPTNQIHLWTDGKHNDKPYECFKYDKYAYTIDPSGQHLTLNNLKVKKVKTWSKQAEEEGMVFEHDVPATTRVLIDRYSKYDDVSQDHSILFFDIEIEKGLKYSKAQEALNVINAISYYDNISKQYRCLLLDRQWEVADKILEDGTSLKRFGTEEELLMWFVKEWKEIKPSIVTGWNSNRFDIPYLYNRLRNLFGEETANLLSPIGIVKETRPTVPTIQPKGKKKKKPKEYSIEIAGIASMDYMLLYQKFTYNEEASFKLEAIAQKVLGRGKVQYEGTLDDFYKNDIDGFVKYNVTDVELLVAMDAKLNLIDISRGICHKGYIPYNDFSYSTKYLDGAIQNLAKRQQKVTYSKSNTNEGKAKGAFVKPPKVGLQKWLASIDLQSLYPNIIITCNISPETQVAEIKNWDKLNLVSKILDGGQLDINKYANFGFLDDNVELEVNTIIQNVFEESQRFRFNKQEFIEYIQSNKYSISSRGIVFKTDIQGIVPAILEKWFNERMEFKGLAKQHKDDGQLFVYYDNLQLITKILLNSLYGVLLQPDFRYYDKKNGESVTLTGQSIIKFTDFVVSLFYKNATKNNDLESPVVYQDSDSVGPDSMIRLEDGTNKRIDELFHDESQKSHYIDPTGREFTFPTDLNFPYYDEKNQTIKFGKVGCIEKHHIHKKRFKITTKSGKSIIVSQDHSVMISDNFGNIEEVLTPDLKIGDTVIVF